jgi:LPXTG-motif cell wall-anchored protein
VQTGASQKRIAAAELESSAAAAGNTTVASSYSALATSYSAAVTSLEASYSPASSFVASYSAIISSYGMNTLALRSAGSAGLRAAVAAEVAAVGNGTVFTFADNPAAASLASISFTDPVTGSVATFETGLPVDVTAGVGMANTAAPEILKTVVSTAKATSATLPKTGDSSETAVMAAAGGFVLASALTLAGVSTRKRRR